MSEYEREIYEELYALRSEVASELGTMRELVSEAVNEIRSLRQALTGGRR